jgi:hypothetical protein
VKVEYMAERRRQAEQLRQEHALFFYEDDAAEFNEQDRCF